MNKSFLHFSSNQQLFSVADNIFEFFLVKRSHSINENITRPRENFYIWIAARAIYYCLLTINKHPPSTPTQHPFSPSVSYLQIWEDILLWHFSVFSVLAISAWHFILLFLFYSMQFLNWNIFGSHFFVEKTKNL